MFRSRSLGAASVLAVWLVFVAAIPAQAQGGLPGFAAKTPKTEAQPSPVDARVLAESQLAEARRQLEASRLEEGSAGDEGVTGSERQRLLDRLVGVYATRLKFLERQETLKRGSPEAEKRKALLADFSAPPPYSVLRVDALRDELAGVLERLSARNAEYRALEAQKADYLEDQLRAAEAARKAEDRVARKAGGAEAESAARNQRLAAIRLKLADGELSNAVLALEVNREEVRPLQESAAELQAVIARVLPHQKLTGEELAQVKARLNESQVALADELERVTEAGRQRTALLEKVGAKGQGPGEAGTGARLVELLEVQIETDRVAQITLGWLRTLNDYVARAWMLRHDAMTEQDRAARWQAVDGLRQLRGELDERKHLVEEIQRESRTAVRLQESRLEAVLLDSAAAAHEGSLLESYKLRQLNYQRVDLAAARFQRELERWLADFGAEEAERSSKWQKAFVTLKQLAPAVWNFELFAVEEATVVDGKTVSVSYGVTVRKSIGVLFLFAVGYLVFSLLARWLQRIIVYRFGVDEQVAVVVRRWVMALAMVVLLIFVLNLARIPLTVFAFMGGALAIGIGFGTQTIIKNFISGIIMLFERKVRVGDIVALPGVTGHVTAIDMRASTVRGFDGIEALVPNSQFLENQVVNWTYSNPHIRREVRVGIAYGSPVQQAAEIMNGCAEEHGLVLEDPKPEVYFEDFGDSALLLILVFWVEFSPGFNARRVDSDLRFEIEKRLGDAGIAIPYPQRDVHLSMAVPLPVELAGASGGTGAGGG